MRFFHLSDLHIGKQLFQYSLYQEQRDLLAQVVDKIRERKPDAVLISGDIYDKSVPSVEAVQIFDAFLTALTELTPSVTVCIIAGNHDNASRLAYAGEILCREKIYIAGLPPADEASYIRKVTLEDAFGPVHVYLLPFMKPGHVRGIFPEVESYDEAVRWLIERESIDCSVRNVILTHQFYINGEVTPECSGSEVLKVGSIDSVDVRALEPFDYAAMGHVHRMQKVGQSRFVYSGTMFPYSVSEALHEKGFLEVELLEKGSEPKITKIPLTGIRTVAKLVGTLDEIVQNAEQHKEDYVSITLLDEKIPYGARDVLESYFSNILEIRFDNRDTKALLADVENDVETTDPLEIFVGFFEELHQRSMDEEEYAAVVAAINRAKELEQA